jgi:PadR family transcriptional regulator PadR
MRTTPLDEITPLTPQAAAALLALSSGPKHGYALADHIRYDSEDRILVHPGSTYALLARLVAYGLARDSGTDANTASPHVRKMYELTDLGWQILEAEAKRYGDFAGLAQSRLAKKRQHG